MSGQNSGHARAERVNVARDALKARLTGWTGAETEDYVSRGYPPYWLSLDTDTHLRHAEIVHAAEKADRPLTIDLRADPSRAATEVTVYAVDDAGLFSRIAAGIALAGANIVDAKIFTMANGMALDSFWVQSVDGRPVTETAALRRLKDTLEKVISKSRRLGRKLDIKATLPARTRVFRDQPRVVVDNAASNAHTVVEVNGRDRPGFLYDVTHALTELNLQISSAKVSTYGTRAVDVFYVKDIFGLKITHDGRIAELRARLLEALIEPEEERKAAASPSGPAPKPAVKVKAEARAPSGADRKKAAKSKSKGRSKAKGPRAAGSRRKGGAERRPRGTAG
jgi:[protein-PII] uridylyltransferase